MDSVAEGGNYDGLAGVIAGLLCLNKASREAVRLRSRLKLLALRAEEAVWFGKTYLGSSSLLGRLDSADLERPHFETGRPLREYLEAVGADVGRISAGTPLIDTKQMAGWLELHIEQGPNMVRQGVPVAVVTGIRGSYRHNTAWCRGAAGHSGAVPRSDRHDPVFALAQLIARLDDHWHRLEENGADLVVTCGIIGTDPRSHAATRIPGDVTFSLDIRSLSSETLESFYQLARAECASIEQSRGVTFEFDQCVVSKPTRTDDGWVTRFRESASRLGYRFIDMASGAGHDSAVFSQAGVPSAMIFVRNEGGSHNPDERLDLDDFIKGVEVLYQALLAAMD
jgi:N-carbamoyl-L-amino-acid hydrolase